MERREGALRTSPMVIGVEPAIVSACPSGSSEGRSLATPTAQLAQFLVVFLMCGHIALWGFNKYFICHGTEKPAPLASSHPKKLGSSPAPEWTLRAVLEPLTSGAASPCETLCW